MPRTNITEFSNVASENTDINSVNIAENCPASTINDALREIMKALKDVDTGSQALTALSVTGATTSGTLKVSDGGTIGSASKTDAITIASSGLVQLTSTGIGAGSQVFQVIDDGATLFQIRAEDGNVSFPQAGAGIFLGVTSGNSANLLDDYEEGSWTPVLGGATSDPTVSYTGNNAGAYTKIGNVVHVVGRVNTTSVSGGSGTALIRGLPFATSGARNAGAVGYISQVSNSSGYTTTGLNPDANASTIRIVQSGSGLGGATVSIGNIGNGFDLTFSHTYRV